jgi:hypothetical protein
LRRWEEKEEARKNRIDGIEEKLKDQQDMLEKLRALEDIESVGDGVVLRDGDNINGRSPGKNKNGKGKNKNGKGKNKNESAKNEKSQKQKAKQQAYLTSLKSTDVIKDQSLIPTYTSPEYEPLRYDISFCIEVAEHLPPAQEDIFLSNLRDLTKHVLVISWSAETMNTYHLNPKNATDVIPLVESYGFREIPGWSRKLKRLAEVEWIKENVLVFKRVND